MGSVGSTPTQREVSSALSGYSSSSLRSLLNHTFGSGNGSLRDFRNCGPPSGETQEASSVDHDSAIVYGKVNNSGGPSVPCYYRFSCGNEYDAYQHKGYGSVSWSNPTLGERVNASFTGLNSSQTYYYTIQLDNAFKSGYDNEDAAAFQTDAPPYNPPSPPSPSLPGGGGCLLKGSTVELYNGKKSKIENLEVGDTLRSASLSNFEDTNDVDKLYSWAGINLKVRDTYTRIDSIEAMEVDSYVSINKGEFRASNPHSQLVRRNSVWRFLPIEGVEVGDRLLTDRGEITFVMSKEIVRKKTIVFKMSLNHPHHTFYGNGILTHNVKIIN